MSLTITIVMLIAGWLAVAAAMLWGVLRITRRHHHHLVHSPAEIENEKPAEHHATAHLIAISVFKKRPPEHIRIQAAFSFIADQASVAMRFCLARRYIMFKHSIAAENTMAA